MKITELLESSSALRSFVTKSGDLFQPMGRYHLFIWTDKMLRALIKAGAKSNQELRQVQVPNEIGLGIINTDNGHICVGAIDQDYEALWASSVDVSDFFAATGNKKLIRLPNRLQNLADMLKRAAEPEVEAGGVDAIVDYIEEYQIESLDVEAIKAMRSVDEVRDYLETVRDETQAELDKTKEERGKLVDEAEALIKAGDKKSALKLLAKTSELSKDVNIGAIINSKDILNQRHLFVEPNDDDGDDSDIAEEIDNWTSNFNRDFPDLDLRDAREFSPQ